MRQLPNENREKFTIVITGTVGRNGDYRDQVDNILHQELVARLYDQVASKEFLSLGLQMESGGGETIPNVSYPPEVEVPAPELDYERLNLDLEAENSR